MSSSEIFFNGPAGRIEGIYSENPNKSAPLALVLHPHPQYGGSIRNRIISTLYNSFAKNGFSVLAINFRGVGRSEGSFDKGIGELSDAAAALDWLQSSVVGTPAQIWSTGFSFGSLIALQLVMRRPEISNFISISTPANKYDFGFLSPCPVPGLMIHGKNDSIADEVSVSKLAARLSNSLKDGKKVDLTIFEKADHFFRENEHMKALELRVDEYIKQQVSEVCSSDTLSEQHQKRFPAQYL